MVSEISPSNTNVIRIDNVRINTIRTNDVRIDIFRKDIRILMLNLELLGTYAEYYMTLIYYTLMWGLRN